MSVVSALCWVNRGKFRAVPENEPEDGADADAEVEEEEEEAPAAAEPQPKDDVMVDPELAKYNLDKYDDDEPPMMVATAYKDQSEDPNLVEPEDDSDAEEAIVMPTDMFVLAATTDVSDDYSHLDAHLYEEGDRNMFCHHDLMLPAFPLCVAWLDAVPGGKPEEVGNFAAVGTCERGIEIWNLDVLDPTAPTTCLGGYDEEKRKKKRKGTHAMKPGSHRDAVMSLSWNKNQRNLLASGSADHTVKTWDVNTGQNLHTYGHHTDKVQVVSWHPSEPTVMLTCSYDHRTCIIDSRTDVLSLQWRMDADPESADWVPSSASRFMVSAEDGTVRLYDAQAAAKTATPGATGSAPIWTLAAHGKAVTCVAQSPAAGLIATGSVDRHVKLWNVTANPVMLYGQDISTSVYSASFCQDSPFLLAIGSGNGVRVWDTLDLPAVHSAFAPQNAAKPSGKLMEVLPPGHGGDDDEEEAEAADEAAAAQGPAAGAKRNALVLPKLKPKKKKVSIVKKKKPSK